jgi:hypothetical protein
MTTCSAPSRSRLRRPSDYCGPATPDSPCESSGLGCSGFARHYFRNHGCFLLLGVLRWFTSPGSLHHPMDSDDGNECSHSLGFPIRKSPDHSLLAASRGLSQLTTSFFAFLRQGIHTHALSSLTIKSTSHTTPSIPSLRRVAAALFGLPVPFHLPLTPCRARFRLPDGWRYFLALTFQNLCFVCPSIFSCQRSRLHQQPVELPFNEPLILIGWVYLSDSLASLQDSLAVSWWAWVELNHRPHPYQGCALAI